MSDGFETWQDDGVEIGRGAFGTVKKVITDRGEILAAKYINPMPGMAQYAVGSTEHEVRMLRQMKHENIVRFVAVKMRNSQMVVFTEFIDGESMKSHSPVRDTHTLQDFIKQICSGLHYMHTCNPPVLHRDIKGDNIMVTRDGTVKLIDFGLSMNLMVASGINVSQFIMTTANGCGTLPFMAPELFNERCQFSVKSDVWALGMTIYQMVSGLHPLNDCLTTTAMMKRITRQGSPALPGSCPEPLLDFYACCTRFQPGDRMSVRELLRHRYLAGKVWCRLQ